LKKNPKTGAVIVSYEYDAWGNIISKVDDSKIGLADKTHNITVDIVMTL